MQKDNKQYFQIFKAGKYEFYGSNGEVITINFTNEDVKQIADNYSPSVFEANLHIGHFMGEPEQPALAWIDTLKAEGGLLFCSFSHVSDDAVNISMQKHYKKCSVELDRVEGKPGKYLVGLGFTNYPKVTDLPPFQFSSNNKLTMAERGVLIVDALKFSETDKYSNPNNLTNNVMEKISKDVLAFAERIGLSVTEFNSDKAVLDSAAEQIAKLQANFAGEPEVVKSLSMYIDKYANMPAEIETFKTTVSELNASNTESLINAAIAEGRILPAEKETYLNFAKAMKPEEFKTNLAGIKVKEIFKKNAVDTGANIPVNESDSQANLSDPKFKNADGSALTFSQFAKRTAGKTKADKDFVKQFTLAEVEKLPGYKEANS